MRLLGSCICRVVAGLVIAFANILLMFFMTLHAAPITYTYDSLNRLIQVDYGDGTTITYSYDAAGNRLTRTTVAPAVRPDLMGSWVSLTQTCKLSKGTLKCSLKGALLVKNQGTMTTPASSVRFFLSKNATFAEGETLLGQAKTSILRPGFSKQVKLSATLPSGTSASGKFVLAILDPTNAFTESNEINNAIVFGPIP